MPERDDLGRDLLAAVVTARLTEPEPDWADVADRVMSYGWQRRPQPLTAKKEIAALPVGTVVVLRIRSRGQVSFEVWQRRRDRRWYSTHGQGPLKTAEIIGDSHTTRFESATVVWAPQAEAGGR